MWQKQKKYSPIVYLALLLALAGTPMAATMLVSQIAVAQTEATNEPTFPLPTSIANNTIVRIDGSSSMARINESLKQSFEQKFSGAKVELATSGTNAALKSLVDGKIDLAAIGRELTPEEEAQGLEQKRLRREKIAIVVGENNPFKGNITNQQFAKMFRGEITNWSQVGGKSGKIRFIDRPNQSDTREALRSYPAFKDGKFATGANATQLSASDTAELVKQLGNDGIGYVIANQVSKVPGLRVLKLHQTLPNDPRYPFSQPLVYAYMKNASPGVAGFLGFATNEPGTQSVDAAIRAEAEKVAQSVASGTSATAPAPTVTSGAETATSAASQATNTTGAALQGETTSTSGTETSVTNNNNQQAGVQNTRTGSFPWWLLLPLAALGVGILWWLLGKGNKRSQGLEGASTLPITGAIDSGKSNAAPQGNSFAVTNSTNDDTTNNTAAIATGAANGGSALASTGATGIGLWPRLGGGNIEDVADAVNINTHQPQTNAGSEISVLSEPAAVVMPTHAEVSNLPQVDLEPTASIEAPSREPELTTSENLQQIIDTPSNQQPLPDVWEDTEPEPTQTSSNSLDNVSLTHNSTHVLNAAVAGGAAAADGELWSRFSNRDQHDNESNNQPETDLTLQETSEAPAIPSVELAPREVNIPDVAPTESVQTSLQTDSAQPNALENPVDTSEIIETISIEPADTTEQLPDAWFENPQPTTESGSSWLDNIQGASESAVAGGAALSGASLWSSFANTDNNEPTAQANEIVVDNTEQDLAASTNIPEVSQTTFVEPTASIDVPPPQITYTEPEVPQTTFVEPTASIDVPEVPQVTLEEPSITEPLTEVQDASLTTRESGSNWLGNIATAGAVAGGAVAGISSHPSSDTNNESNNENLQPSNITGNIYTENAPTSDVAEVASPDLASSDTPQFNTTLPNNEGASDVISSGDIGSQQWVPSDSDTETTQADIPDVTNVPLNDVPVNAVVDDLGTQQNEANTLPVNTEPSSTPELNINPSVLAGGAAVAGVGAVIESYNHENKTDTLDVAPQPPVSDTVPEATTTTTTTTNTTTTSQISFTARTPKWAYVAWNIDERDKQIKKQAGAAQLALRLYDTTDTDLSYQVPQLVQQYECEETIDDRFVAIPGSDRDYMAEIGYLTSDNQWLSISRSHIVRVFSRPFQEFWFEADAELIIHGATEPGSTVTIGGQSVKLKSDGTFHLRIPFTDELIDYVMTAVAKNGEKAKTIHMHFEQNK